MRPLLALVLLLPLAACGGGEDATPAAQPSASPAASSSAAPASGLVPSGEGLAVGGTSLPFGSPEAEVTAALTTALGPEDPAQEVSCSQGERTSASFGGQDFLVLFDEKSALVGWNARSADVATDTGLRVGSTRADVEKALPGAAFTEDTLGPEFGDGQGVGGLLDGDTPTSTVTELTGGEACFAR